MTAELLALTISPVPDDANWAHVFQQKCSDIVGFHKGSGTSVKSIDSTDSKTFLANAKDKMLKAPDVQPMGALLSELIFVASDDLGSPPKTVWDFVTKLLQAASKITVCRDIARRSGMINGPPRGKIDDKHKRKHEDETVPATQKCIGCGGTRCPKGCRFKTHSHYNKGPGP